MGNHQKLKHIKKESRNQTPDTEKRTSDSRRKRNTSRQQVRSEESGKSVKNADISDHLSTEMDNPGKKQVFLTGVNIGEKGKEPEMYAIEMSKEPDDGELKTASLSHDKLLSQIDKYRLVSVVDSAQTFSFNDCVFVKPKRKTISYMNFNSQTTLKVDELISSYDQVERIGHSLA